MIKERDDIPQFYAFYATILDDKRNYLCRRDLQKGDQEISG